MIRCRLKLRAAVLLLLILRNGAFVEGDISCLRGINVDGTPGYNNKNIPTSTLCQPEEMCLRVRIDELKSDTGSKLKNVIGFSCMLKCKQKYEYAQQSTLETNVRNLITGFTDGTQYSKGTGYSPVCCGTENCNAPPKPEPEITTPETPETPTPETSSGSNLAASLTLTSLTSLTFTSLASLTLLVVTFF